MGVQGELPGWRDSDSGPGEERAVPPFDSELGARPRGLERGVEGTDHPGPPGGPAGAGCRGQALLGDRYGAADLPPYAAPARATDLAGLPPASIDVGAADMFRDEGVAYANALRQAGGQAELHVRPGAYHGFDTLAPRAAVSRDASHARTRRLHRLLARSGPRTRPGAAADVARSGAPETSGAPDH